MENTRRKVRQPLFTKMFTTISTYVKIAMIQKTKQKLPLGPFSTDGFCPTSKYELPRKVGLSSANFTFESQTPRSFVF